MGLGNASVVGEEVAATTGAAPRPSGRTGDAMETRSGRVSIVVPVYNASRFLPVTVPAILTAAERFGDAEVVFVDNGSTDRSFELLEALARPNVRALRLEGATISGVRNFGASHATGDYLGFLDADCVIPEGYCEAAVRVLRATGAVATGCQVDIPAPAHWIEATWHKLHFVGRDRFVHYLNSGNFFISRRAFEEVGGFSTDLTTGEDAEIGQRLVDSGRRIYESGEVSAVHLGNPKSIRQYYRRSVWHALGMFGTVGWKHVDKPTAMMFTHLLLTLAGLAALAVPSIGWSGGMLVLLGLQLLVPAATVAFRARQVRRIPPLLPSLALYWLYYWARLQGLGIILIGAEGRYRK